MWTFLLLTAPVLLHTLNAQSQPQKVSPCVGQFDISFRKCFTDLSSINLEAVFYLVTNGNGGKLTQQQQGNIASLKQNLCGRKAEIIQCFEPILTTKAPSCTQDDFEMMKGTINTMTSGLGTLCGTGTGGQTPEDAQCMKTFETGMNVCAQKILSIDMELVLKVLNKQPLPQGQDPVALKKNICSQRKSMETCGKNVILNGGCARAQLLGVEVTFANVMLQAATFCGDKSLPGACLLTLQNQFTGCYGKVGLKASDYVGNESESKGALIGATTQTVQAYCVKKHDLFTCMQEVVHQCPGAEQTLSLTGFDLNAMERGVGRLCHNIPMYLEGLNCFSAPTEAAKGCMKDMSMAITGLATKKVTQKLTMDDFLTEFCAARVKHVGCDAKAWPTCNKGAVNLKNEFECELIPSKCYNSHKDNIDVICKGIHGVIPTGNASIHVDKSDQCAQNIGVTMNTCFSSHGLEPDMFLINVTHDRSNFLGENDKAKSLCDSRQDVFACMRNALKTCPNAKDVLSFWGHQQSALEGALNIVCNELPLYNKGHGCFNDVNAQVQQCVSTTENKMMTLANKQVEKNLSPDSYFRDFCKIRIEHLKCDLNSWSSQCASDVLGLKTEYECRLIQQHCKNLQVTNFKNICNDKSYAKAQRQSGTNTGPGSNPGNTATVISSTFSAITSGFFAVILALL